MAKKKKKSKGIKRMENKPVQYHKMPDGRMMSDAEMAREMARMKKLKMM